MKTKLLLPRGCRIAGLILLPLFFALFIAVLNYDFVFSCLDTHWTHAKDLGNNNLTDEVAISGVIISLFMIAFSRLRHEDEYISAIRLKSLQIGVYANYGLFVLLTFLVYNGGYLAVLFYNIPTTLLLFIIVFNYNLYIAPRFAKNRTS